MLADFFTKPLQERSFRFFRNISMGYTSIIDVVTENPKIKEHVEISNKHEIYNKNIILTMYRNDVRTQYRIVNGKSNDKKEKEIKVSFVDNERPIKNKRVVKATYTLTKIKRTVKPTYAQISRKGMNNMSNKLIN